MSKNFKSGFVALIGRPNVGKSTLLNSILKQKVSIVSDKAQTTRNKVLGVYTESNKQIVFIDTPGVHKPKHRLGHWMRKETFDALEDIDAVVFMVAVMDRCGTGDKYIAQVLKKLNKPIYLVISKIDTASKADMLKTIKEYQHLMSFAEIIPISAISGSQVDVLLSILGEGLPQGPLYYPEDMVTDRPERNIVGEIIREKLLLETKEEIPHAIAVEVEEINKRNNGITYIRAVIYVERESQKRIVIGKKGSVLKTVGEYSRKEIQELMNGSVYLDIWVKISPDWRNKDRALKALGYE